MGGELQEESVVESIRAKVREQIEKLEHLVGLVPADRVRWNPQLPPMSVDTGHVLGHLLECLAGFCAVFYAAYPEKLAGIAELRSLEVNHCCMPDEAITRIRIYADRIEEGFKLCTDSDLRCVIPTVFSSGESMATLLLGNLEHLISHKYQLFMYLKMSGVPLTTRDIYCWRGKTAGAS